MKRRITDFDGVSDKCVDFILTHVDEQFLSFYSGKGDIYDKYLYHCTPNGHRDDLKLFIKRSTMFIAENTVNYYADNDDLDKLYKMVGKKLALSAEDTDEFTRRCKVDDLEIYENFYGKENVEVVSAAKKKESIYVDISKAFIGAANDQG